MWQEKLENDEVLEFIYRRFQGDSDWLSMNSFYFAHILCSRFEYLNIYFAPVTEQFIAGYNGKFYDWCGEYDYDNETAVLLTEIQENDPEMFDKLVQIYVI